MTDPRQLVRTIVEDCWSQPDGLDRMAELVGEDYVHHTPMGDWDFAQFRQGVAWIEDRITERSYRLEHLVAEGDMAAAYISWRGIRTEDGAAVEGRGAYHCRIRDGRVREDWDVFFPAG